MCYPLGRKCGGADSAAAPTQNPQIDLQRLRQLVK
jgi:hypothetical protein